MASRVVLVLAAVCLHLVVTWFNPLPGVKQSPSRRLATTSRSRSAAQALRRHVRLPPPPSCLPARGFRTASAAAGDALRAEADVVSRAPERSGFGMPMECHAGYARVGLNVANIGLDPASLTRLR